MAIATVAGGKGTAMATRTVRHFALAVGFALVALAAGSAIYLAEKYLFDLEDRFVENPASVMMQAVGLAHFWIGWLFLFTSPSLRAPRALRRLVLLTLLGIALCWVCALCGASRNPFIFLFFYGFFLIHEIRDQTNLYQAYGDSPNDGEQGKAFLHSLSLFSLIWLTALLCMGFLLHGILIKHSHRLLFLSPWYYLTVAFCLCCLCIHTTQQILTSAWKSYGSLGAALAAHKPITLVYLGIFLVLLLGIVAGSVSFNLIILIHAGAWLVFVYYKLAQAPARPRRTWWTWIRHTPNGFLVLHVSVIALILVFLALRVYQWQKAGLMSELFAGSSFPYWSLMHITMAFWRPR